MNNADILRLAARDIAEDTAVFSGVPTECSCQAVWGRMDVMNDDQSGGTTHPLTVVYKDLFAPYFTTIADYKSYWLDHQYSGLSDAERKEFRITALLLYAAMLEAGDV